MGHKFESCRGSHTINGLLNFSSPFFLIRKYRSFRYLDIKPYSYNHQYEMNRFLPTLVMLLSTTATIAAGDIVLPGLGEQNSIRWLPVDDKMSSSAYREATSNNIKVLQGSVNEYIKSTGVPEGVIGVTGSAIRLLSGDDITLFNSQGLSINNSNINDSNRGAFMSYSVDW